MRKRVFQYGESQSPDALLQNAIESFYRRCEAKNLSKHTVIYYRYRFEAFVRFLAQENLHLAPTDITPTVIREFLADETARVSALTAQHSYVTLKCFFRYLVSDGQIEKNPIDTVEKVRQRKKVIPTFTDAHIEKLLATCGRNFTGLRDQAILYVLLDCGLRVSELCNVTLPDIAWDGQTLRVLGKGLKERIVPFGKATQRALYAYIARRGELSINALFVTCYATSLSRQRVLEIIKERAKAAEITGVTCSPHNFRRYFAISFLRNGGDVFSLQKILGHTSLEMTRRYAELAQTDIIDKHRQFSPGDALRIHKNAGRKRIR